MLEIYHEIVIQFKYSTPLDYFSFVFNFIKLNNNIFLHYKNVLIYFWICSYCCAFFWYEERSEKSSKIKKKTPKYSCCCMIGNIKIPKMHVFHSVLQDLMLSKDFICVYYLKNIQN